MDMVTNGIPRGMVLKVVHILVGRKVRVLFSGACQELGNEIFQDP